ncbi:serine hydroxymethyltransferase [Candidatus Berkelbacteria bacterium]|nr:serine hydroxymethyltransferase [Candidatus Berkelbacteria bacterium]
MKTSELINQEEKRQLEEICLIASENHTSPGVRQALGSVLVNKYAEGYPGKRYYAGNKVVDLIEQRAIDLAKKIFGADHANVQPLSGAPANLAVYSAILEPGDTVLGMDLSHGGHLTHGHPVTLPAKLYKFIRYKTTSEGKIDYDQIATLAKKHKPKLILVGYSSYSRDIDYQRVQEIANQVGAITMADISHIAGLVAAKLLNNPVPLFDIITSTTHKTLRGPRGGIIMCKQKWAEQIDKAVFPGLQGGPHQNQIAALTVALEEAQSDNFKTYAEQILENSTALAIALEARDFKLAFNGTENHLMLIDLRNKNVGGLEVQLALEQAGIIANMNVIPDDPAKPTNPSGLRLGTPAITTRGMGEDEVRQIADWLEQIVSNINNVELIADVKKQTKDLALSFPPPLQ